MTAPTPSGSLAIVTGAGSGIGRASAVKLVADGYRVVAFDVDEEAVRLLASEHDGRVYPHTIDLASLESIEPAVADVIAEYGPVDVVVNAAGMALVANAIETDRFAWQRVIDVNLTAPFLVSRAVVPGMIERGGGSIVNIASVAGPIVGVPRRAAYSAAKAALVGLTKSMAVDFASLGIRVNAILPGTVETGYTKKVLAVAEDAAATREFMTKRQLIGRMGTPEEIADAVAFLVSPSASFFHGSAIVIDGGMTVL